MFGMILRTDVGWFPVECQLSGSNEDEIVSKKLNFINARILI